MTYEYEIKIPMWLEDGRWLNMNVDDEVLEELEEVYRKAKAFDKLVEFYPQKDEIPSDEFFMMMGYIIKECADDER